MASVPQPKLPRPVIRLGITSLIMDVSTESMLPFIPFYLTQLGATGAQIGLCAGICELAMSALKFCSGWISDLVKRRLPFLWIGYLVSPICKLLLALTKTLLQALILIPLERSGKGIRTAPRDALIKHYSRAEFYGAAFGFHRMMDTLGALIGAGLAIGFMSWGLSYPWIFLSVGLIGILSLIPLLGLREPEPFPKPNRSCSQTKSWIPMAIMIWFGLGNLSVMFFLLRAGQLGTLLGIPGIPLVLYLGYNAFYAGLAYPAGLISDRYGNRMGLGLGYLLFCLGCLSSSSGEWGILPGFLALGASMGFVETIQRSLVAELSETRAGLSFGIYHSGFGLAGLAGNLIAGLLWDLDPRYCFGYGALISGVGLSMLILLRIKSWR